MNVFIGCSSKESLNHIYIESTTTLANYLSTHNYDLMCGGTDGLMKILVNTFKKNNRTINLSGVKGYFSIESENENVTIYNTVSERKHSLIHSAHLMLFLPGGLGTMDEIFTAIESKRAKEHNIPIIIININHYYDNLINQLNTMYQENFATAIDNQYYHITNSIEETIQYIEGREK